VRDARRRGEDIPLLANVNSPLPGRTRVPSPTGNQAGPSRPSNPPRRLTITDNDVEAAERKAVAAHAIAAEATAVAEKEALELEQQAAKQARAREEKKKKVRAKQAKAAKAAADAAAADAAVAKAVADRDAYEAGQIAAPQSVPQGPPHLPVASDPVPVLGRLPQRTAIAFTRVPLAATPSYRLGSYQGKNGTGSGNGRPPSEYAVQLSNVQAFQAMPVPTRNVWERSDDQHFTLAEIEANTKFLYCMARAFLVCTSTVLVRLFIFFAAVFCVLLVAAISYTAGLFCPPLLPKTY